MKKHIMQLIVSKVRKRDGSSHRKCTLTIPKEYSDTYPDHQQFFVEKRGRILVYIPVEQGSSGS